MKNIVKSLFVLIPVAMFAFAMSPAQAYIYQPRQSYIQAPYQGYNQYSAYGSPYGYQDTVSALIQGQVNFVDQFRYVPAIVRPYFYPSYYSPYSYYGYGSYRY